ncbi:MAG: GMC oxidoreductase [Gammaproteobacteria bacterium]
MRRLSSPIQDIKSNYSVVIIGSGYGGGISASRLARAGQNVCVLERGREFLPGEFPDTLAEALDELQMDSKNIKIGKDEALFDLHTNEDINVLVGCGLGGTSLINANVLNEADARVFDAVQWPLEFLKDKDRFAQGIEKTRMMLAASPYPENTPNFPKLNKLEAMKTTAQVLHEKIVLPDIAVNFKTHSRNINHVGVEQMPCNLCGDCCSGCNNTAKNTVHMTYLPDAKNHGAEIFTQAKVSHIKKQGDKWVVYYASGGTGKDKFGAPDKFVLADIVIIAAGTLGSNEIMLRSKQKGLDCSDEIGKNFTGNSDVLAFAYNTDPAINSIGRGASEAEFKNPAGPCITSVIDTRQSVTDYKDGINMEEGALPGCLAPILPKAFSIISTLTGQDTDTGLHDESSEKKREIESLLRGAYHGATQHLQTYLVMGHDSYSGKLYLENDRIRIDWPGMGNEPSFNKIEKKLIAATKSLGGTFVKNPITNPLTGNDQITVHPLGGCRMGEDASKGVVNHKGQVFNSHQGTGVHDGLYIADGSIIPTALGTNPLLTISAICERNVEILAEERHWHFDTDLPSSAQLADDQVALKPGIQFTETMIGFFASSERYETGFKLGEVENSSFKFTLTVTSNDVEAMLKDPNHQAAIHGTVIAPSLSSDPLNVTEGVFNLLVKDPSAPETSQMKYLFKMTAENGDTYYLQGHKVLHNDPELDSWSDTTTLYITITTDPKQSDAVIGRGILKITPENFMIQLQTIKVLQAKNTVLSQNTH